MSEHDFNGLLELSSGKQVHAKVSGSGPEAVLLMHGLGSGLNYWGAVLDAVPDPEKYRFVRYDFDGASSSPLSTSALSFATLADDAIAVLDKLGIKRAAVVGHSMSGFVAAKVAAEHPDRVSKLVLVGAITFPAEAARKTMQGRADKAKTEGMFNLADAVPTSAFSKYSMRHRRVAYHFVRHIVGRQDPKAYAAACLCIANCPSDIDYAAIKAPTLIIAGDEDQMSPASAVETFKSCIKDCRAVVIKDCGHWMAVEDPEATANALGSFLSG